MNYKQLEKQIKSNIEDYIDIQMEFLKGLDFVKRKDFYYNFENLDGNLLINFDGGYIYDDLHDHETELFEYGRAVKIFGLQNLEWSQYDNVSIIVNVKEN